MNKNILMLFLLPGLVFLGCANTAPEKRASTINVNFTGPSVSPEAAYTCWIESEAGVNIQNLYVCNRIVGITKTLTGDALPYWKTVKYVE